MSLWSDFGIFPCCRSRNRSDFSRVGLLKMIDYKLIFKSYLIIYEIIDKIIVFKHVRTVCVYA